MAEKKTDLAMDPLPSDTPVNTRDVTTDGRAMDETEAILMEMRDRMNTGWDYWSPIYLTSKEDVIFAYDDQWPAEARRVRKNRPQLTMNMIPEYINQVMGQARKSKFAIQIRQLSGKNDTLVSSSGTSKYSRAQVMEGMIRDIEQRSKAAKVYCRSLQHALEGGIGWLRIRTERPDEDPFALELKIEHVRDRYSVVLDPFAELEDYSDARYVGFGVDMPEEEFKARWPDIPETGWRPDYPNKRGHEGSYSYWRGRDRYVNVLDYYWKEPMKRTAQEYVLRQQAGANFDRLVVYRDEIRGIEDELKEQGYELAESREVESFKVKTCRAIWGHILEGPYDWPSTRLPVIPVTGRRINLDTSDAYVSLTRFAKDPQRFYNYWVSSATERVSLVPKAPYILSSTQIQGHETQWNDLQVKNQPYLLYNHETEMEGKVPPPSRQETSTMPTAEMQLLAQCRSALQDSIGIHDAGLGQRSNEVSGSALERRMEQGSNTTFDFIDNLATAIQTVGEILADMIPKVYTNDVARKIVLADDSTTEIWLNHVIVDEETEREFKICSLDHARYSCAVSIGPTSATQREHFVKMMMEWGRSDPESFAMFRDIIVENMDLPNGKILADRMKMSVPRQFLSEEDQQKLPPPQPTPEQELAQMDLQVRQLEAQAQMAKAQSDMEVAKLRVEADRARTQFEAEKGLNRQEQEREKAQKEQMNDEDAVTEEEVQKIVASAVKREMAKMNAAGRSG